MIGFNNSCEIFTALSLKAVYNKYSEWLQSFQDKLRPGQWMAIIDIKSERETATAPNRAEGFATVMQNFMQHIYQDDEMIQPTTEEKEQRLNEQQEKMKEFFDTEPTQYFMLVTYKVYQN